MRNTTADLVSRSLAGDRVVMEVKRFKGLRRRFREADEREAFVEERLRLDWDRRAGGSQVEDYFRTLVEGFYEEPTEATHAVQEPCPALSDGNPRDNSLVIGTCGSGKTALFTTAWYYFESVHNRVVVSRDDDASTVVLVARDEVEALRLKTCKLAAVKRLGMILRTRLSRLHGLIHAARRLLAPPGRLVTSSPQHTRGPNTP
ncbi:hypothetical protein FXN61_08340 [Lentzea sp. PSKA42]|uniref:Uncharacterized protein n=1 Tax=Lentzea indica TaxID=2604800 RepID=A0ABX1FD48_9PSEU|nr:hypothetical protein [Lentzea indica]NKE56845.1 hypothetical protein [Lentzea indica]